jgi:hypothetical protein
MLELGGHGQSILGGVGLHAEVFASLAPMTDSVHATLTLRGARISVRVKREAGEIPARLRHCEQRVGRR